jgi:exopolysaccharide biosynthesis protein
VVKFPKINFKLSQKFLIFFNAFFIMSFLLVIAFLYNKNHQTSSDLLALEKSYTTSQAELNNLKNQDQYKINEDLKNKVNDIKKVYTDSVSSYESILKLKERTDDTRKYDVLYKELIILLSDQKYDEAQDKIKDLNDQIAAKNEELNAALAVATPVPAPASNTPPASGYSRQQVSTSAGTFTVAMVAADLGSTKVIVDTASDSACPNNCPALPLAEYVSRNNAFAGVNGSYFCPADYPSCAGKENSFDTLLMNKNKTYFNSDNNVYSNVPAVIFGSGWVRFVARSEQWGRDTSIDSMIANQGLLVQGGNITYGDDGDPKKGSFGARSFVANKGSTIYIGVVFNATVAQSAIVMHELGMENALNLDDGGSTALWSGGYKAGPGRPLPNAILFVQK